MVVSKAAAQLAGIVAVTDDLAAAPLARERVARRAIHPHARAVAEVVSPAAAVEAACLIFTLTAFYRIV